MFLQVVLLYIGKKKCYHRATGPKEYEIMHSGLPTTMLPPFWTEFRQKKKQQNLHSQDKQTAVRFAVNLFLHACLTCLFVLFCFFHTGLCVFARAEITTEVIFIYPSFICLYTYLFIYGYNPGRFLPKQASKHAL